MRAIDINTMIGPWSFGELIHEDAAGLETQMDRLGIERSFVFHSQAWRHNPRAGNQILADEIRANPKLVGVMLLTPLIEIEHGGPDALAQFARENRMGAIRLYPTDHSFTLNPWNVQELMGFADQYKVPVFIDMRQCDGDLGNQYGTIHDLAKAYPGVPIVLLTVGYRHMRILLKLMECCANVSIDTSTFITFRGIEEVVKYLGSDRVLFGSRTPFIEPGASLGRIIYADLSEADRHNIAFGNAERLLRANKLFKEEVCDQ